ncbi:Ger(x)C family spore germination protein [Neobacillus sp. YIM B06451]|uniref:Ger(x)C family spore germination protein n=1 Tax=Neobacillus sp. YIM B06451 TaxID=3070994 RepID=UPI00292D677A|nr:Ger(x)C family spore germination protein [Neobacillus sp. YIM B06451]
MNRKTLVVLSLLSMLIAACERTKIVDQLSIVNTIGFDTQEDGQLRATSLYPDYTKSKSQENLQIRKTRGNTSTVLIQRTNAQSKNPIELSKTQAIVFGEDFAKKGIGHIVDTVFNNPMIATDIQVAVVTPSASKYLETVKKNGSLTIADTINQNYNTSSLPRSNLHIFLNNYYGHGRDPYMPFLKHGSESNVYVDGVALFKDDQYKVLLDNKQVFFLGLLDEYKHSGYYELPIKKGSKKGTFVIRTMKNKPEWLNINPGPEPKLDLSLNVFVVIREYPDWINLHEQKDITFLEKAIKRKLKTEIAKLIRICKENGVDPLGLGDRFRAHDRNWDEQEFYKEQYKKMQVNIKIEPTVIQAGIKR